MAAGAGRAGATSQCVELLGQSLALPAQRVRLQGKNVSAGTGVHQHLQPCRDAAPMHQVSPHQGITGGLVALATQLRILAIECRPAPPALLLGGLEHQVFPKRL